MASHPRSAKSGGSWTKDDLVSYNIEIVPRPPVQFFDSVEFPASIDGLDPDLVTLPLDADDGHLSYDASGYFRCLKYVVEAPINKASFDRFVLETLRFVDDTLLPRPRNQIPFIMSGELTRVIPPLSVHHDPSSTRLLLIADAVSVSTKPEPQVIAAAIAAFQLNNKIRQERGLLHLPRMTMPCMTMCGACPTFYLVPVTDDLNDAVITAQYPLQKTEVLKCETLLDGVAVGIGDVEYRKLAFRSMLSFLALAGHHWQDILQGIDEP